MRYPVVFIPLFTLLFLWIGCGPSSPSPSVIRHHAEIPTRDSLVRKADIYLPPGYFSQKEQRYPVLYMQDGQNLFYPDSSVKGISWGADTMLDMLIAEEKIPPCILVGVWSNYRRILEYLPNKGFDQFPDSTKQRFLRSYKEPESDWYLKILIEDIKPFVDAAYRTLPDAAHTFVAGSSSGGLIALYALNEYPEVFGGAACMSTHWPISPRNLFPDAARAMVNVMGSNLPDPATHKIYFDYGSMGNDAYYESYQKQMDSLMVAKGYKMPENWETREFPGSSGFETEWGARMQFPLEFLLSRAGE